MNSFNWGYYLEILKKQIFQKGLSYAFTSINVFHDILLDNKSAFKNIFNFTKESIFFFFLAFVGDVMESRKISRKKHKVDIYYYSIAVTLFLPLSLSPPSLSLSLYIYIYICSNLSSHLATFCCEEPTIDCISLSGTSCI